MIRRRMAGKACWHLIELAENEIFLCAKMAFAFVEHAVGEHLRLGTLFFLSQQRNRLRRETQAGKFLHHQCVSSPADMQRATQSLYR